MSLDLALHDRHLSFSFLHPSERCFSSSTHTVSQLTNQRIRHFIVCFDFFLSVSGYSLNLIELVLISLRAPPEMPVVIYPCLFILMKRSQLLSGASFRYACFSSSYLAVICSWVVFGLDFLLFLLFCFPVGACNSRPYYVWLFDVLLDLQLRLACDLLHYISCSLALLLVLLPHLPVPQLSLHRRSYLNILPSSPEIVVLLLEVLRF